MIFTIIILSFISGMGMSTVHSPRSTVDHRQQDREMKGEVPVKDRALQVLNEKCNVCHRRQNPRKVFTEANMDDLAPAIYKQVFVKKRMPRGNTIKLTDDDRQALMAWLSVRGVR